MKKLIVSLATLVVLGSEVVFSSACTTKKKDPSAKEKAEGAIASKEMIEGSTSSTTNKKRIDEQNSGTNISNSVVYPLNGCAGKTIRVIVVDQETQERITLGPFENKTEVHIDTFKSGHSYTVSLEEFNAESGTWEKLHSFATKG